MTDRGPRLDVREYVLGDKFSGFTRRGIRLDAEAFEALLEHAEEISQLLIEEPARRR